MENISNTLAAPASDKISNKVLSEHIVEIVSDSGEGAQKAGQSFGAISAKMGNALLVFAGCMIGVRKVDGADI